MGRRAGYFCTAGYTETGGIEPFLKRLNGSIDWQRCFPAVDKPAPKLNRPYPTPVQGPSHGATGSHLVDRMLGILRDDMRKYKDAEEAQWQSPADITRVYATASILPDNRVVFNIRGNTYRLIVKINYSYGMVYIRFVGTHAEYDRVDATKI